MVLMYVETPPMVLPWEPEPPKVSWMALRDGRVEHRKSSSAIEVFYHDSEFVEEGDLTAQGDQSTPIRARKVKHLGK